MNRTVSIILPYYNRKQYLKVTLDSFEYHYSHRNDIQIVIVDDGSASNNMPNDIINDYSLNIKLIRIENKKGMNPCYPNNVGVRNSDGDIIVLSSPEILHTCDIFEVSNDFEKLTNGSYLQFSVFCVVDVALKNVLLADEVLFKDKVVSIKDKSIDFHKDLGCNGYLSSNNLGAWYTHSKIANNCYNFLSACTRKTYYDLSGFNEAFVNGTGYDDAEFRDRLLIYLNNNVIWYDDFVAIHIDHSPVSSDNNTNFSLYNKLKNKIYEKNDLWGQI